MTFRGIPVIRDESVPWIDLVLRVAVDEQCGQCGAVVLRRACGYGPKYERRCEQRAARRVRMARKRRRGWA